MLRKLHKAPTGGSLFWPKHWDLLCDHQLDLKIDTHEMFAEIDLALTPAGWLAYLWWLLVFLPLACKSFSDRVSVTSLRFNAAGINVRQKLSCTLLKLGCILWWVIVHCWDSQVPCVCPVPWEPRSRHSLPRPEWRWPCSVLSWKPYLNDLTWSRGRAKSLTPVDGFQVPPGSVGPSGEGHSGSEDRLPSLVCPLCGQALLNVGGKITPGFLTSSHVLPSSPPPHRESAVCFSSMRFNYLYCWVWLWLSLMIRKLSSV